jgi:hypothetical protein
MPEAQDARLHQDAAPEETARRLAACEAALAALRAEHAALLASRSWRFTAPLRRLRALPGQAIDRLDARLRNDLPWDAQPWAVRHWRRLPVIGPRLVQRELVRRFIAWHGQPPRLDPPIGFSEHVLHRMIFDRDPRLRLLNDKLRVREVIAERAGAEYVVPLLGVWTRAEAVPWHDLPLPCVLKPSHSSGAIAFLRAEADRDPARLLPLARRWLGTDYFDVSLEWGYRDLPRRLLAEPLLRGPDGGDPPEAQVLTFGGRPEIIRVMIGPKSTPQRLDAWFDTEGVRLPMRMKRQPGDHTLPRETAQRLAALAEKLGAGFVHLRVDFFLTAEGPKVGELTPYMLGGSGRFQPAEWDLRLGRLWTEAAARG